MPTRKSSTEVTWIEDKTLIQPIRAEIWHLVQNAKSMEIVHWYVALDDCFENDEFHFEDATKMRWQMSVLKAKGERVALLYRYIDEMLPAKLKWELVHER